MRNFWKYLLVGLLAFGLVFAVAFMFLSRGAFGYRGYGMMGNWGYFPMMGGFGMLGGLMMLLFIGLPVVLIILAFAGVFGLLNRPQTTVTPPAPTAPAASRTCPECGKPAQADWTTCPYCGQKL